MSAPPPPSLLPQLPKTVAAMRAALRRVGLPSSGRKEALRGRLYRYLEALSRAPCAPLLKRAADDAAAAAAAAGQQGKQVKHAKRARADAGDAERDTAGGAKRRRALPPCAARWLVHGGEEGAAEREREREREVGLGDFEPYGELFGHVEGRMRTVHGLDVGRAEEVVEVLKRCLIVLIVVQGGSGEVGVEMPAVVAKAWREAVLETREYGQMCVGVFGTFLHYSTRSAADAEYVRRQRVQRLETEYVERFGDFGAWVWGLRGG